MMTMESKLETLKVDGKCVGILISKKPAGDFFFFFSLLLTL